jgi:hypothetical protein
MPSTFVYDGGVVDEWYRWDETSYDAVGAAGLGWQTVQEILRTRPRIRTHIGAVLRIVAQAHDGRWIVVALIEERDDESLVVSARLLNLDEITVAIQMIERGRR